MRLKPLLVILAALRLAACVAPATPEAAVPPAALVPSGVASAIEAAPDLSMFARAVRAAGLTGLLSGSGPVTVFAPSDQAFGRLAPGMAQTLLAPENRETLATVLRHHIVPGAITVAELRRRVAAGGGSTTLTTAAGQLLAARVENGAITLTDHNGTRAYVEASDVRRPNGVMHVVNGVLVPPLG